MVKWVRDRKWQDLIFGVGGAVFMASLLPSVFGSLKPAPITSLATALMLSTFLAVYVSYKLWIAFGFCVASIALWVILFFQAL